MKPKNIINLILLVSLLFFNSCKKEDPVSAFKIEDITTLAGQEIHFTNTSKNSENYLWDFGDGYTSTEIHPVHIYTSEGHFIINLTAFGDGPKSESEQGINITAPINIFPGTGMGGINIENTWLEISSMDNYDFTVYPAIEVNDFIFHQIIDNANGIMVFLLSVSSSTTINANDVAIEIHVGGPFIGQTETKIKLGTLIAAASYAYGEPEIHDTYYQVYDYPSLGIGFYYNNSSKIEEIFVYPSYSTNASRFILEAQPFIELHNRAFKQK